MNPATIMFYAKPAKRGSCAGCVFEHERSTVCHAAGAEAKKRQVEDCEAGYIYATVETDPRQIDIFGEAP